MIVNYIASLHQEKKKRANDLPMVPTTCQRRANGANDVPTVPFLHVQKFGTKFSIVGAN
jgi:hypothetical protein